MTRKPTNEVIILRAVIAPTTKDGRVMYEREMKCKPLTYPKTMKRAERMASYCNAIRPWLIEMTQQGYRLLRIEKDLVQVPSEFEQEGIPVLTTAIQLSLDF